MQAEMLERTEKCEGMEFPYATGPVKVMERQGKPVMLATDLCRPMGLKNISKALRGLPSKYKLLLPKVIAGQARNVLFLTGEGVLQVGFRSNRPEADKFREFFLEVVYPAILKGAAGRCAPGAYDRMASARIGVRPYLHLRDLNRNACGLSHSASAWCRRREIAFTARRHGGNEYPLHILDEVAASAPDALPSPLAFLRPAQMELPLMLASPSAPSASPREEGGAS